ncbi:MAG: Archaeal fructose-1,6-bisphosphatase of inositol monophosphatase family [Candidatus Peregrinibacteria bacterium Gr01-1014_25]|nr:MAG: Archaeal fructose-1,6-bisphosphatase of inositol monophosphatase family [Candidatus Peregrinibacteria bacterium Gr01-1014_25]
MEAMSFARDLARRAGELALEIRRDGNLDIEQKTAEAQNIVTRADRACEELIAAAIRQRYPNHAVRGEEGVANQAGSRWQWIIDPIDGTYNFSRGRIFSVSIGLAHDGESVAGALFFPDDAVLLSATRGGGADRNGTRIERSSVVKLADARLAFDVSAGGDEVREIASYRQPLEAHVASVERTYCSTSAARGIIEGTYDAHICGGLTPYDIAAAIVILREAGCAVACIDQKHIDIDREKIPLIMAADPQLLEEIETLVL